MNNFTQFVNEARKNYDSCSLLTSEITSYIKKVNKIIPQNVQAVIYLTQKYNLLCADSILDIKNANKGSLSQLASKYDIPLDKIEDLWKLLKEIKNNIKLLPQFMSDQERKDLELGKLSTNDLTIDLDTSAGRNAAAKMYSPLLIKIVNQFVGKSNFDRSELMSSALLGFTNAMNDWRKNDDEGKTVPFKTYAGYRVRQQILNDINQYSHTLSGGNSYNVKKYGAAMLDAVSIDGFMNDDEDINQDRLAALGISDKDPNLTRNEEKHWKEIYKLIEDKFKQRDIDIFYRYFGLNGYKREKSKDIAKSFGMSEGNIRNAVINKILLFLKKDHKASEILQDLQDAYNESLMVELIGFERNEIIETLISDDMFILLEELNKWNNKRVFKNAIASAYLALGDSAMDIINNILRSDFESLDDHYKINKKLIIRFLSNLYPSENMSKKTDVSLLNYMQELQELYKKYKL